MCVSVYVLTASVWNASLYVCCESQNRTAVSSGTVSGLLSIPAGMVGTYVSSPALICIATVAGTNVWPSFVKKSGSWMLGRRKPRQTFTASGGMTNALLVDTAMVVSLRMAGGPP